MKPHRATPPSALADPASPVAGDLRQLTSAEIAAVYNARTGEKLTSSDVRHVLKKAHDKLTKALNDSL